MELAFVKDAPCVFVLAEGVLLFAPLLATYRLDDIQHGLLQLMLLRITNDAGPLCRVRDLSDGLLQSQPNGQMESGQIFGWEVAVGLRQFGRGENIADSLVMGGDGGIFECGGDFANQPALVWPEAKLGG